MPPQPDTHCMDSITASALSSAVNSAKLSSQVSTAVAAKSQDAVKQQGDAAVAAIQQAAELGKVLNSGNPVQNGRVDTYA